MPQPAPIPFNRPFVTGKELDYVAQAVSLRKLGGDGRFTEACSRLMEGRFGVPRVLLTPSCTAALEMTALLCDLKAGDEVIMPSFTFVSTANAVVARGARPVFVEIRPDTLNIDENRIEEAITSRTRAIVPVHYAGVACEMDRIMALAGQHGLTVIEDAAQGVHSFYRGRALGSIGHLGCYSFHETKNYVAGEGGALCVNDARFLERATVIRHKGTDRSRFLRGLTDKYSWVDVGSSYVPSEIVAAFLYGQLERLDEIRDRRRANYDHYHTRLAGLEEAGLLRRPVVPDDCEPNWHMYYVVLPDHETRDGLLAHLNGQGIHAVFHYVPLHDSPMARKMGFGPSSLPVTESMAGRLLRLPLYFDITEDEIDRVVSEIARFLNVESASVVSISMAMPHPNHAGAHRTGIARTA